VSGEALTTIYNGTCHSSSEITSVVKCDRVDSTKGEELVDARNSTELAELVRTHEKAQTIIAYPIPMTKGAVERETKKLQASRTEKTRIARKVFAMNSFCIGLSGQSRRERASK